MTISLSAKAIIRFFHLLKMGADTSEIANVEEFSAPTNIYNKRETFSVNGVRFEYGYSDISFGYHDTIFDHGIISDTFKNIRISQADC